ncbi:MAG: DEAD/DEAH box helicase [Candidatus Hydrothermarchaeales archaeon]
MKFEEYNLGKRTLDAIDALGYKTLTPIQEEVLPLALSGKDVVGQSCTGSGKTATFSIPIAERIKVGEGLKVLVVVPTRELCLQITKDIRDMARNSGLKVLPVYGGQPIKVQLNKVGRADVIVATPGRLLDHLRRRSISLGQIEILILDEADRMLDMGFIDDIRKIIRATPRYRQTMLFGATIPGAIRQLSRKYMKNPEYVEISKEVDTPNIEEFFIQVPEGEKFQLLRHLLDTEVPQSAMIFCNTRRLTDTLAENLKHPGFGAMAIHGDMKQAKRERVIESFYKKEFTLLCATDVASRGLDISDVSHIINYEVPMDPKDYTHRIGRTARMGKKGKAVTLLSPSGYRDMRNLEKELGSVEFTEVAGFNPETYAPLNPRLRSKDGIRSNKRKGGWKYKKKGRQRFSAGNSGGKPHRRGRRQY